MQRVPQQLVLVAGPRAAALDGQAFAGAHEDRIPLLLEAAEQGRERNVEGA